MGFIYLMDRRRDLKVSIGCEGRIRFAHSFRRAVIRLTPSQKVGRGKNREVFNPL